MTAERWRQITGIFHAALTRDAVEREAFVASRCAGDTALQRAVTSMLAAHQEAGAFGETPPFAWSGAPDGESSPGFDALSPGTRLGPYEIVWLLGAGGMGAVYRARDTRLERDVAVKVLLPQIAHDRDRFLRFSREARVLASLNHPNVAQVYGLEEAEGARALVMELVEGDTLTERIAHGAIPTDEALHISRQIADALEAAHQQKVVHRDLKPANIKLRSDGVVKVLDFGLAKALSTDTGVESAALLSLHPSPASLTGVGVLVGTAAYMAPEQACGRPVDERADIWAFGCVLYEMLTGRRAFEADDVAPTLAKVLGGEPDLDLLPAALPARVRQVLRVCLQKDPKQRASDIRDVRLALDGAFDTSSEIAARPHTSFRRIALPLTAAVVAMGLIGVWWRPQAPAPQPIRFEIHAPPGSRLPLGTPAVSPDGRTIAYVVAGADDVTRIHVRPLDRVDSRALPGTEGVMYLFWSPDSRSLAFTTPRSAQLKRVDVAAGSPRVLSENVSGGWAGAWGTRGDILFSSFGMKRISPDGGAASPETPIDPQHGVASYPVFLRDGRRFLMLAGADGKSSIRLGSLGASTSTTVVEDVESAPLLAPTPGGKTYLLFARHARLMAQAFDEASGTVRGDPAVLVGSIGMLGGSPTRPTIGVSPSGVLTYQPGGVARPPALSWVDRFGKEVGIVPSEAAVMQPRLSPDGSLAAGSRAVGGAQEMYVVDLRRGSATRVTFKGSVQRPVWSADGSRLAFSHTTGSAAGLYVVSGNGGDERRVTPAVGVVSDWSPNGRYLLYQVKSEVLLVAVEGTEPPVAVGSTRGRSLAAQFSPDGRYIAYVSNESGQDEVYVRSMPPATTRWKVSLNGGTEPRWPRRGKELFFMSLNGATMAAAVTLGKTFSAGVPQELFGSPRADPFRGYDVSADGQRILLPGRRVQNVPITVVLNWWAELSNPSYLPK